MSVVMKRLHLDEIVTSFPELGPTNTDRKYSWFIFIGILIVQMTIPSILSIYGTVLGYMNSHAELEIWIAKVTLTPIFFTAFSCLADPWTNVIVHLASIPRLVGLIGVALLSIGILASGYLATGGVGAYLASLSASAVMGIGASLVSVQSDQIFWKHFRTKVSVMTAIMNVSATVGLIFIPIVINLLIRHSGLETGLLLIAIIFLPTAFGTLIYKQPGIRRSNNSTDTTPYSLLRQNEDHEVPAENSGKVVRTSGEETRENMAKESQDVEKNCNDNSQDNVQPLSGEGSDMFVYDELDEDVELFVRENSRSYSWKQEFQILRFFKFWMAVATWIGIKSGTLFLFTSLPSLLISHVSKANATDSMAVAIVIGIGTLIPNVLSFWSPKTARWRSLNFGAACLLGSFVLFALTSHSHSYIWYMICAYAGGVSIATMCITQEHMLRDLFGAQSSIKVHKILSTIVGFTIILMSFIQSHYLSLRIAATLQLIGGLYWIIVPTFEAIRARYILR